MTLEELKTALSSTGYPVAYDSFPVEQLPAPPFIVFYVTDSNNFFADGEVYKRIDSVEVALITKQKNPTAEGVIEAVLPPWEKEEEALTDERVYEVTYSIEIEV